MNDILHPERDIEKSKENSQFSDHGVYVREDDQDWGSAGMNNIEEESSQIQ